MKSSRGVESPFANVGLAVAKLIIHGEFFAVLMYFANGAGGLAKMEMRPAPWLKPQAAR
jgi:hypothetical protein